MSSKLGTTLQRLKVISWSWRKGLTKCKSNRPPTDGRKLLLPAFSFPTMFSEAFLSMMIKIWECMARVYVILVNYRKGQTHCKSDRRKSDRDLFISSWWEIHQNDALVQQHILQFFPPHPCISSRFYYAFCCHSDWSFICVMQEYLPELLTLYFGGKF